MDSWRLNHDRIQSVTAIELFCRKRIAVHLLNTRELGMFQHQAIVKSEMTPVLG
jgi:hypothetical protein